MFKFIPFFYPKCFSLLYVVVVSKTVQSSVFVAELPTGTVQSYAGKRSITVGSESRSVFTDEPTVDDSLSLRRIVVYLG